MIATLALSAPAGRLGASSVLAGENQKSGPIGLAVILALCVVSYLLFKSMSRHMRKVREEFPAEGDAPAPPAPDDKPGPAPVEGADTRAPEEGAPG